MATRIVAAARQALTINNRISSSSSPRLLQRRGLAGSADHHGPPKVNCWQEPGNPGNWKEEQFVIVSLSGWGLLFFSGYKFFSRGSKKDEKVVEAAH